MSERLQPSTGALLLAMTGFLLFGGPTVYFLWHELSTLFYGRLDEVRWSVLLVSILVFAVLLAVLARWVRGLAHPGWEEENA